MRANRRAGPHTPTGTRHVVGELTVSAAAVGVALLWHLCGYAWWLTPLTLPVIWAGTAAAARTMLYLSVPATRRHIHARWR